MLLPGASARFQISNQCFKYIYVYHWEYNKMFQVFVVTNKFAVHIRLELLVLVLKSIFFYLHLIKHLANLRDKNNISVVFLSVNI